MFPNAISINLQRLSKARQQFQELNAACLSIPSPWVRCVSNARVRLPAAATAGACTSASRSFCWLVAAGTWFFMRPKPTEVTTVVAEADSSGPSLGTSVLNASGYVVARRMATVSSKVTGKMLEIYRRRRHGSEEGPGAGAPRSGEQRDHADDGGARARSLADAISRRSKCAWPTRAAISSATKRW